MANSRIFAFIRHPQYASFLYLFLGIVCLKGSWESFALFVPYLFVMAGRVIPEERELVARFGESYVAYRKRTPAVFPRRNISAFARYLIFSPPTAERA